METSIRYPIRYVSRQTGLKPHLIRAWEERYGAVHPERAPSNQRLYSDADIRRLELLKTAVDHGHAISAVAPLSDSDLQELVARGATRQVQEGDAAPVAAAPAAPSPAAAAQKLDAAIEHIRRLDVRGLETVLSAAAVAMPRQAFLGKIVLPLFRRIGNLWQAGELKIVNEHMASVTIRAMLWDMLRTVETAAAAPCIVVGTPAGHRHEFGALAAALTAAEAGWQAHYFGPDLPSEELAYAAHKLEARAICLSLCHQLDDRTLPIELTRLRRAVGPDMPVLVGGPGAETAHEAVRAVNGWIVNDLETFRRRLEALTSHNAKKDPKRRPTS